MTADMTDNEKMLSELEKVSQHDADEVRRFNDFLRLQIQFRKSTGDEREALRIKLKDELDRMSEPSRIQGFRQGLLF